MYIYIYIYVLSIITHQAQGGLIWHFSDYIEKDASRIMKKIGKDTFSF